MRKRNLIFLVVALVLIGVAAGFWYLSSQLGVGDQLLADLGLQTESRPAGVLAASGIIEAEEVSVTTELGGRVAEVLADEGDLVEEGAVVISLDDALPELDGRRVRGLDWEVPLGPENGYSMSVVPGSVT